MPSPAGLLLTIALLAAIQNSASLDELDFEDSEVPDFYLELNVTRTATPKEIKRAFRKLALRYWCRYVASRLTIQESQQASMIDARHRYRCLFHLSLKKASIRHRFD